MPLFDGHERLRDELLPIVHECHQVAVTIRAQDMTDDKLTRACTLLKETEDYFHATIKTDPRSPLWDAELEMFAFSDPNDMNEYWKTVYSDGSDAGFAATYLLGSLSGATSGATAVALLGGAGWDTWVHEYAHHLDWTFNQTQHCIRPSGVESYLPLGPGEGLAEYITKRDYGSTIRVISDGSNLPSLVEAWRYWEHDDQSLFQYGWGYLIVRFLFEEHPQVILTLYDIIRAFDCSDHSVFKTTESYASEALVPLADDFHRWARSFANLTRVRQIEPVTLFLDGDGNRVERDLPDVYGTLFWREYFHTSLQDLALSASFSIPHREVDNPNGYSTHIANFWLSTVLQCLESAP